MAQEMTTWYRITFNNVCFGIIVDKDGIILRTAPIAQWAVGKHIDVFLRWVAKKNGKIKKL